MIPTPDQPVAGPTAGKATLWLAIVVVGVAFFLRDHDLFVSLAESYDHDPDIISQAVTEGRLLNQAGMSMLGLLGWYLLARKPGAPLRAPGPLGGLILFGLVWCVAGLLWAEDTVLIAKRLVALLFCFACALGLARQLTLHDLCVLALGVAAGYALLGLAVEVALGTFRPLSGDDGYRFAGTVHPNGQGMTCALICLSAGCLLRHNRRRALLLALIGLAVVLLMLTKSRTALITLVVTVALMQCLRPSARLARVVLGVAWLASGLALFVTLSGLGGGVVSVEMVLMGRGDLGEAATLTGRTDLWEELVEKYVAARPLLGYGYASFWTPGHVQAISTSQEWGVPEAHSLYLELLLNVGAVGALVYLAVVATALWRSACGYLRNGDVGCELLLALLVYGLVMGVTESAFLETYFSPFVAGCGVCRLAFFSNEGRPRGAALLPGGPS